MADDDEDFDDGLDDGVGGDGDDDLTDGLEVKKTSGKKIVMLVAAIVVLGLITWGVMALLGGDDESHPDGEGAESSQTGEDHGDKSSAGVNGEGVQNLPAYLPIENLLVNLNTGGRGIILLRISVALELESEDDRAEIDLLMPAIINDFQVYLRSLRPDDLEGTKGLTRIQEELLVRINQSISPKRIRRILFEDFLITPQ